MDPQLIIIIAIASAILILALVFLLVRRTVLASIAGFSWQRIVELEHYIWVKENSYGGYPKGSRDRSSTPEIYHTYEVTGYNTRTTYNADGTTSTTSEPIHSMVPHIRTKYMYEIQRWCKSREVVAEGRNRKTYWPSYVLNPDNQERVRTMKEKYLVSFQTAKGKQYQRKLPESGWITLDDHQAYRLRVTLFGRVTRFEPDPTQVMVARTKIS